MAISPSPASLCQGSDAESFNSKPTPLSSTTLDKVHHVLDYRCIVGGGEQLFLLALGVRQHDPPPPKKKKKKKQHYKWPSPQAKPT